MKFQGEFVAQTVLYLYVCVPSGAGMVADWEQGSGILLTSGDVRIIRVWDTSKEMKVQVNTSGLC